MKSIAFPNMFSSTRTKIVDNNDQIMLNLSLLLNSEAGSLYGDPYFGTRLRKFIYEPNNIVLHDLIIDEIYLAILTFMPQLHVMRKDIKVASKDTGIYITINCINKVDNLSSSYEIKLLTDI